MNCNQCGTQFEGKFCPNCGAPASAETPAENAAPATPVAEVKKKNPIYKKWWFWVILVVAIGVIGNLAGGRKTSSDNDVDSFNVQGSDETSGESDFGILDTQGSDETSAESDVGSSDTQGSDETTETETETETEPETEPATEPETDSNEVTVVDFSAMGKSEIEDWATTNNVNVEFSEEYSDTVAPGSVISQNKEANETIKKGKTIKVVISIGPKPSVEYLNALKKAETYSKLMHMSKMGIYDQLTSEYGEQFPADAAQYAIDNLDADYKANALAKAKTYQQTMSMSKSAIYDQLISEYGEQFTAEEAQYAIDNLDN